jgi:DNA-binding SARP family transcriptional activator/tetratricopeptide (TPR) repeat protein
VEFQVLGPVEVHAAGQQVDVGHPRQRAVLAVLLLQRNSTVTTEQLVDRVWGEEPPKSVRNVLYGYVAKLRAGLAAAGEPDALTRRDGGYLIRADEDQVDLYRFRRLVAQAARAVGDDQKADLLRVALGLWHGEALGRLSSPWLRAMRDALQREKMAVVLDLGDIMLAQGQPEALADELAEYAAGYPADERLAGQLMLALARSGRRGEALQRFEQTRRWLAEELGADPGPELRALHQQLLRNQRPSIQNRSADDHERGEVAAGPRGLPASAAAGPREVPGSAAGRRLPGSAVPRQLPAATAGFTGRAAELAALELVLGQAAAGTPGMMVISAIGGMGGVGKTALALHWAHQAAARFPDGQLYVNLRGFDPTQAPAAPAEAIRGFLDALGVPPGRLPLTSDAQAGLYRSLLADRRMLIVADNACDEQQVRPLLPASSGSLVLVTSRRQLTGLAATEGARLLTLDVLPEVEARQLLASRIGTGRAAAEPEAVSQIADLCGCLPLALAVAAARAAARPRLRLAAVADELRDSSGRLDALDAGDPAASVRAVFSWSYQQLSPEAARMFRLLGIHPGPDITAPAAASLAATSESEAGRLLAELTHAHLITEHLPGRHVFHDLLRDYAAEQARRTDGQNDRDAAIGRVLDHYLHTAARAGLLVQPAKEPVALAPPRPGASAGQHANRRQAMDWFEGERQVLVAAVSLATGSGFDSHAWQLSWAMSDFLGVRGYWQDQAATLRAALAAATRLGDTTGQALSSRLLAGACSNLGDLDQARRLLDDSLGLYQRLGNGRGEARVQQGLGALAIGQGRYADGLGHSQQALQLSQALEDKAGQARALNDVGWFHGVLGDYQQARAFCRQALTLAAEASNRGTEGTAWDSLGYAEHHLGNLTEAAACYQRAVSIFREFGARFNEAIALTHLGDTRHAAGELAQAREAWQRALAILDDLQHPDADQVQAKLTSADVPPLTTTPAG